MSDETTGYDEHLRERAQTLLNGVTPGGVPPAVAEQFLRELEQIITERREMEMWSQHGLSGSQWVATYPSQEAAAEAVQYLASDGHGHHFAVLGEGASLVISKQGTECLQNFHQAEKERAERLDPDRADWGSP